MNKLYDQHTNEEIHTIGMGLEPIDIINFCSHYSLVFQSITITVDMNNQIHVLTRPGILGEAPRPLTITLRMVKKWCDSQKRSIQL